MRKILLSPHNDDAVLFCGFAICEHPDLSIVTVFDSYVQPNNPRLTADEVVAVGIYERRREDVAAIKELGSRDISFAGLRDDVNDYSAEAIRAAVDIAAGKPDWTQVELWIPMYHQGGHAQHNAVATAFQDANVKLHLYTTYIRQTGRVREHEDGQALPGTRKVVPDPEWIIRKLRALSKYESQITIKALGCWPWFMDLQEYIA